MQRIILALPVINVSSPSAQALRMHHKSAHKFRNGTTPCVLTNQCPICRAVCKTKEVAWNHVRMPLLKVRALKNEREKRGPI